MKYFRMADKYRQYSEMFQAWINLKQQNILLESYFEKQNIKTIAIYGKGKHSEYFIEEIKRTKVKISYFIDKNASFMVETIPVLSIDIELPVVDAIIVTIVDEFDMVLKELKKVCDFPVFSLEDIIYQSQNI